MAEQEVLVVVAVPVGREYGGYLLLAERLGVFLRMGDVGVLRDTTVLRRFLVVGGEEGMHLVAVAQVGGKERPAEVGGGLVAVIASGVGIVKIEAEAQPLAGVDGKLGIDVVFA